MSPDLLADTSGIEYGTGTFAGGSFANDPLSVRHLAGVAPDPDSGGAGRHAYRILLNGAFTPSLAVESGNVIRVSEAGDRQSGVSIISFDDGCDTTAAKAFDGPVSEVLVVRWLASG